MDGDSGGRLRTLGVLGTSTLLILAGCTSSAGPSDSSPRSPAAPPSAAFITIPDDRVYFQALMTEATLVVTDSCLCAIMPADASEVERHYRLAFSEGTVMEGDTIHVPGELADRGGSASIGDTVDIGGGGLFGPGPFPYNVQVPAACDIDLPIWAVTNVKMS